jgi:hypothetical protein
MAATRWSVQIDQVDPGSLDLPDSFQVPIFENLVGEVKKIKQFQRVFREGDHGSSEVPNLLVLKITVESHTPGSETRRAVTTVSGATKLRVRANSSHTKAELFKSARLTAMYVSLAAICWLLKTWPAI